MSKVYKSLYAFLTVICMMLSGILFVLITKDDWAVYGVTEIVLTVIFFLLFPIHGWLCRIFERISERNRERERIDHLPYQTEPHGIRYTQHRREG